MSSYVAASTTFVSVRKSNALSYFLSFLIVLSCLLSRVKSARSVQSPLLVCKNKISPSFHPPPAPCDPPVQLARTHARTHAHYTNASRVMHISRESLTNSEENARLRLSSRSLPNGTGHRVTDGTECLDDSNDENIMKRMLQLSLLRDPLFIIFTISNFCTSIGFNVPYVYLLVSSLRP
jgi:hypothetical protein